MAMALDHGQRWACVWCGEHPVRTQGSVCAECRAAVDDEAADEDRVELLDRGAYDDEAECPYCGAETAVSAGLLVASHARFCPAGRSHLRVVS